MLETRSCAACMMTFLRRGGQLCAKCGVVACLPREGMGGSVADLL